MIRVLYWNIKKKGNELLDTIKRLSNNIDILIIAELCISDEKLRRSGDSVEKIIDNVCLSTGFYFVGGKKDSWIYLWARNKKGLNIGLMDVYDKLRNPSDLANKECGDSEYFVEYLNKHERMLFFKISYNKLNFLLVPIHFPSRLFATTGKQKDLSVHFKNYIEKIERKYKLKSIVVGDFNMNPFEAGMIHQEGFYALPTQHLENIIKFYDIPYETFYNPTWEKYGDYEIRDGKVVQKPSGSYFLENSNDINYYWYVLDQVILRKELIKNFCFESFKYITGDKSDNDFLNDNLSPNDKKYSDHLPITFHLKE